MKTIQFALPLAIAAFGSAANAASYYPTVAAAQLSCQNDTVVWIDLDHGRYYKAEHPKFGKTSNGVYSCEHAIHGEYREGKPEASTVAAQ